MTVSQPPSVELLKGLSAAGLLEEFQVAEE
jgi:hypothetical protein